MVRKLLNEAVTAIEYADLLRQRADLLATPDGDGHTVLVAPGLLATDRSTWLLRRFLNDKGYDARGWGLGRNVGSIEQFDALTVRIGALADESGRRVTVIGWSLGGVGARYAAAQRPDNVRQIITLGSPFRVDPRDKAFFPAYSRLSGVTRADFTRERLAAVMETPVVPTTSIASRNDGIVSLDEARQPVGPLAETIEVGGSHIGLSRNADVLCIIAQRLAQPEGAWQPYASHVAG
ncbi:MAG: alpha/beta hydrolase [Actinomycetota bacterium]